MTEENTETRIFKFLKEEVIYWSELTNNNLLNNQESGCFLDFEIYAGRKSLSFPGLLIQAALPMLTALTEVDSLIIAEAPNNILNNLATLLIHGRFVYC